MQARSEREKFAKLCFVVGEADETLFWMESMMEGGFITKGKMETMYKETDEIEHDASDTQRDDYHLRDSIWQLKDNYKHMKS